ncbi:hypothetical protein T459_14548 [Capsicum annuum]|uniref:Exportin-5 C-terminal domain-containing protein n=1 Tax=Capsicum annuum TaxID=4072 RepID=A0A2G2ZHS2_CAPAN|nr:hypothetical protein T459_14548 [Capsicum annuum]
MLENSKYHHSNSLTEPYIAAHNMLLTHSSVVRLYKRKYKLTQHGFVGLHIIAYCFIPHTNMMADEAVTLRAYDFYLGWLGNERILGSSLDPLNLLKSFTGPVPALPTRMPENVNPRLRTSCFPQCKEKYDLELAKLVSEFENSSSEAKLESPRPQLPQWLQSAKLKNDSNVTSLSQIKDQGFLQQKTQELQKKWNNACLQLQPNFQNNGIADIMAVLQTEGGLLRGEHNLLGEAFLIMASAVGVQQQLEVLAWLLELLVFCFLSGSEG